MKVEPREFADGLALWCKALLETLSFLVFRTTLSPGGTPTIPATPSPASFLSPPVINTYTGNALELSPHPVLGSVPFSSCWLCSLGNGHQSRGLDIISRLATLKQTSVTDFSVESQTQSSCCLAGMPTRLFNRHVKLSTSNACFFHTHLHLSEWQLCSCSCSGQSHWSPPSLPPLSYTLHLLCQQIL